MLFNVLRSFRRRLEISHTHDRPSRRRDYRIAACEQLESRALLSAVSPFASFTGVDWTSAGAGGIGGYEPADPTRGEYVGRASLNVDGVQGEIVAGYLYWQGIDLIARGDADGGSDGIYDNETVTFDGTQVTAVSLGSSGTANWGGGSSQAFRADVTNLLRTGNQDYLVSGLAAKPGHESNGVSLVVVYRDGDATNDRDLYILNGNYSGVDEGYWNVAQGAFDYHGGDVRAQVHVADGQLINNGVGDLTLQFSTKAGANYPQVITDVRGQFDGLSVRNEGRSRTQNPSVGLWDIHTFDITPAFNNPFSGPGEHTLEMRQITNSNDSLVLVALLYDTATDPSQPPASNIAPVARNDNYETFEGTPLTTGGNIVGLLENDFDADGDTLTVQLESTPLNGTLTYNPNGNFTYTPRAGFVGGDRFSYRAFDGRSYSALATVSIVVNGVNSRPVAATSQVSTAEDTQLTGQVFASDINGDPLTYHLKRGAQNGTVFFNSDGTYRYIPNPNFNGNDSFLFAASDGRLESGAVPVSITVTPVNDRPVVATTAFSTDEDTPLTDRFVATDVDGDAVTFRLAAGPQRGTVNIASDGALIYTPRADLSGRDTFDVQVYENGSFSFDFTATVDIAPVNDAPAAADDAFALVEDQVLSASVLTRRLTMTSDAGDYIGQGRTYNLTESSGDFTASGQAGGSTVSIRYQGNSSTSDYWHLTFDAPGSEPLTTGTYDGATRYPFNDDPEPGLSVTGQHRGSNTLTGEFTVHTLEYAVDGSLAAFDAEFEQHSEGGTPAFRGRVTYAASLGNGGVLANDTDVEGNTIAAVLVTDPAHGSLDLRSDGSFSYTPDPDFNGQDSFTYAAFDGKLNSAPATVTLTVAGVNDPPTLTTDSETLTLNEDTSAELLYTAFDVDGDLIDLIVEGPAHGTLVDDAGRLTYTPDADFNGDDSFTVRASDGRADSAPVTVSISVRPLDDVPVVAPATFSLRENSPAGTLVGRVVASDEIDGEAIVGYEIVAGSAADKFTIDAAGQISVAADAGLDYEAAPSMTIVIRATDAGGGTAEATITVLLEDIRFAVAGAAPGIIDLRNDRQVSVTIFSTSGLDVTQIDFESLTFGATGNEDSIIRHRKQGIQYSYLDSDGDGVPDAVTLSFETTRTGLTENDLSATLRGELLDGTRFSETQTVKVIRGGGAKGGGKGNRK